MATGPEHYRAGELAFENAKHEEGGSNEERFFLDAAQFHATMALAAATAMAAGLDADGIRGMHELDCEAWDAVAGVQEEGDPDDENALWVRTDLSDAMQTVEIHHAPMPGDEPVNQDWGPF